MVLPRSKINVEVTDAAAACTRARVRVRMYVYVCMCTCRVARGEPDLLAIGQYTYWAEDGQKLRAFTKEVDKFVERTRQEVTVGKSWLLTTFDCGTVRRGTAQHRKERCGTAWH